MFNITTTSNWQRKRLHDELLIKRFNREEFKRFLFENLDTNFDVITSNSDFVQQCYEVLRYLEDQHRIGEFCEILGRQFPASEAALTNILSDQRIGPLSGDALLDYLYLFDRTDEEYIFSDALAAFPEHSRVPPVVCVISGIREDEMDLMVDRLIVKTLRDLYGSVPQRRVPYRLTWTTTATAPRLFREFAAKVLGTSTIRDSIADLLPKVQAKLAGQTASIVLRSGELLPDKIEVLREYFLYWSQLGPHARPVIFFILILVENKSVEDIIASDQIYAHIREAGDAFAGQLTITGHLGLKICNPDHISAWRSDLDDTEIDRQLISRGYRILDQALGGHQEFRMRSVKMALDTRLR
jgi:hypothetical protein